MGNSLACKSENHQLNSSTAPICRKVNDRKKPVKVIHVAEYSGSSRLNNSLDPITPKACQLKPNDRGVERCPPVTPTKEEDSHLGATSGPNIDVQQRSTSPDPDSQDEGGYLSDDEEGRKLAKEKKRRSRQYSGVEIANSVFNLLDSTASYTLQSKNKNTSTIGTNMESPKHSGVKLEPIVHGQKTNGVLSDKLKTEKCPLFTIQRTNNLTGSSQPITSLVNDYQSMLSDNNNQKKKLNHGPISNNSFRNVNSGTTPPMSLTYKRSSRDMTRNQNGSANRIPASYNIMRENIQTEDLSRIKSGLYLNPSNKNLPLSRSSSHMACKLSPLVSSSHDILKMKVIPPKTRSFNGRTSSCTWRTLPITSSNEDNTRTPQLKNIPPISTLTKPPVKPTEQHQHYAGSSISLEADLSMTKIEEFLEKREHIDKSELDLVVRNLIKNSNDDAFPESKTNQKNVFPNAQPVTAVNRSLMEASSSHHKHRLGDSLCRFPAISSDKMLNSLTQAPKNPSGLMIRRDFTPVQDSEQNLMRGYYREEDDKETPGHFRNKPSYYLNHSSKGGNCNGNQENWKRYNKHFSLQADSSSSVRSQRSKHSGGLSSEMTPLKLLKDAAEEFGDDFPLNDKLKKLRGGMLHHHLQTVSPVDDDFYHPTKQLPSINTLPLIHQQTKLDKEYGHYHHQDSSSSSEEEHSDDEVCRHLRILENCTLCTLPSSRGDKSLTKLHDKKKQHWVKH